MNAQEATNLTRLIRALCPSQHIDEFTAAAWAGVLEDTRYTDATVALKALGRSRDYISPRHVIDEVRRIRELRIAAAGILEPPTGLDPDDEAAYRRWLGDARHAAGNGEPLPPRPVLMRDLPPLLEQTFRNVDDELE